MCEVLNNTDFNGDILVLIVSVLIGTVASRQNRSDGSVSVGRC